MMYTLFMVINNFTRFKAVKNVMKKPLCNLLKCEN